MRATAIVLVLVLTACSGGVVAPPSTTSTTSASTTSTTIVPAAAAPPASTTTSTTTSVPLDRSATATAARLQADLEILMSEGPRVSGTAPEALALDWFAAEASAITGIVAAQRAVPLPNGTESGNVWVGPIGSGGPVLLLGAHIDSIAGSPGADDNGSGVLILLEIMRRLAAEPPSGVSVVFVAFGAEEFVPGFDHHYGSTTAATEMAAAGTLPDLMLSVDMVGMGDALYSVPYWGSDDSFARDLVAIGSDIGIDVVFRPRGDISDHVSFAVEGVPSVLLLRGDNPGYHTPADDRVDMDAVLEALVVVEAVIAWATG